MSSVGRSAGPMVVPARVSAAPLVAVLGLAVERVDRTGPTARPGSREAS